MELRDLDAFVAVVEHGGFRAAADVLYLSQPSLTRRLQRLEQDLGVELLERGPWGVRMTGHGEALLIGARRIRTTVAEVKASAVGAWGQTFTLGAAGTAAGSYLAAFLSRWIPEHPDARLSMIEDGATRLRRRLADRECDVALLAAPVPAEFDSLPITRVGVQAVLPRDHPLSSETTRLPIAELHRQPILVNGASFLSTELLHSSCRIAGVQPDVLYESSVGQTLAALAEAGLGIAVMSDNVDLRGFDLPRRPLQDAQGHPLEFDLHVAWSRERVLPPIVYEFVRDLSSFTEPLRDAAARTQDRDTGPR